MLKCKCGGELERLESFSGGFLKCKSCGKDLWLNDIVERCEKAEAELDISKKEYAKLTDKFAMTAMELQAIKDRIEFYNFSETTHPEDRRDYKHSYFNLKNDIEKLLKGGE